MRAYGYDIGKPWTDFNEHDIGRGHKRAARCSFNGENLLSYRTVVARYRDDGHGQYVVVTDHRYSVSTTSHVSNCTGFVSVPIFKVPYLHGAEEANLAKLWREVGEFAEAAKRSWNPERSYYASRLAATWERELAELWAQAESYARFTGQDIAMPTGDRDWLFASVRAHRQAKLDAYNTPTQIKRRERANARRIAKKALNIT
jgi:hypothetical protein